MTRRARLGLIGLACVAVAGCGATSQPRVKPTARATTTRTVAPATTTRTVTPTAPVPTIRPRPKPKRDPGSLPQTRALPSAASPVFHAEMSGLWRGVQANSPAAAMPAFFPRAAYVQVKAISDASGDYAQRLVGDYRLDLAAAHALLGGDPGSAELVAVHVPQAYAHWVDPGACYNRVGYYEVPNARVVYSVHGQLRSFGIASMISWRGVWYVVHLGAVVRASPGGQVDDPSPGAGISTPSSTC